MHVRVPKYIKYQTMILYIPSAACFLLELVNNVAHIHYIHIVQCASIFFNVSSELMHLCYITIPWAIAFVFVKPFAPLCYVLMF